MRRREFIAGISSLCVVSAAKSYAEAVGSKSARLKFGVLSDVHLAPLADVERYLKGNRRDFRRRETDLFEKSLRYFDERGADAVVIAGDLTDWGINSQFKAAFDVWDRVFPGGKSVRDGRPVERLVVFGNHDVAFRAWSVGNYANRAMGAAKFPAEEVFKNDIAGNWKKLTGEDYALVWERQVKGYTFIGAHWDPDHYDSQSTPSVEPFIKARANKLKGDKPFFYIQHPQPKGTCLFRVGASTDNGCSTRALSAFPNAVAFSGHCHIPLTFEKNVWQGAFTSIGTASLDSLEVWRQHENGAWDNQSKRTIPRAMQPLRGRTDAGTVAAHGQFVEVYDGFLEIERRDFVTDARVGANWVIPVPAGKNAPFAFETREKNVPPPSGFPSGAKIAIVKGSKPDRFRIEFPSVRVVSGASPVHDYEIVILKGEKVLLETAVYAPGVFHDPALEKGPIFCEFKRKSFPDLAKVTFKARPREIFGKTADWIYS